MIDASNTRISKSANVSCLRSNTPTNPASARCQHPFPFQLRKKNNESIENASHHDKQSIPRTSLSHRKDKYRPARLHAQLDAPQFCELCGGSKKGNVWGRYVWGIHIWDKGIVHKLRDTVFVTSVYPERIPGEWHRLIFYRLQTASR